MKSKRGGGGGGGENSSGGNSSGGPKQGPHSADGDVDDGLERGAPDPTPPPEEPPFIGGPGGPFDPSIPGGGRLPVPSGRPSPGPSPHVPGASPSPSIPPDDAGPMRRPSPSPGASPSASPGASPSASPSASPGASPSPSTPPIVKFAAILPDPAKMPGVTFAPVPRHREWGKAGEATGGSSLFIDIQSHVKFPRHDEALGVRAAGDVLRIGEDARGPAFDADRFFYTGDGRGIKMKNPRAQFANIKGYVPASMSSLPEFKSFVGDRPPTTQVLEVFDNWNAATMGVAAGVEMAKATPDAAPAIHIHDLMPLTVYATAVMQTIRRDDPEYLRSNPALKETFKFFAERTMMVLSAAAEQPKYQNEMMMAARLLHDFSRGSECLPARQLLTELYGSEWTRGVFGFDESKPDRR